MQLSGLLQWETQCRKRLVDALFTLAMGNVNTYFSQTGKEVAKLSDLVNSHSHKGGVDIVQLNYFTDGGRHLTWRCDWTP